MSLVSHLIVPGFGSWSAHTKMPTMGFGTWGYITIGQLYVEAVQVNGSIVFEASTQVSAAVAAEVLASDSLASETLTTSPSAFDSITGDVYIADVNSNPITAGGP